MPMHVLVTAGHVDHGKSALVRALTGMEPDRLSEERRRGMTLDLGFAWTSLAGSDIAFVDVPGHERFVPTMLAGAGPVPAVLFVVAADQGWQEQSAEHLAILDALGVAHGLIAVTRADLADPAPALALARERLTPTSLGSVEAVPVSAVTGQGLPELRAALERLVGRLPAPATSGRVRLFVDRAFTVRGAGTVVTGTLGAGRLRVGESLEIAPGGRVVRIRGLQALGRPTESVRAVARVAVNLRDVPVADIARGCALATPGAWVSTSRLDARLTDFDPADLRGDIVLHLGSAAVACRVRPLAGATARLTLRTPLPATAGDRAVLRDPSRRLVSGVIVLDVDPPDLRRRGAARARGESLAARSAIIDPRGEIARRGAVARSRLAALGLLPEDVDVPDGILERAGLLVDPAAWERWKADLVNEIDAQRRRDPLRPGVSAEAARRALDLPELGLVEALVASLDSTLVLRGGLISRLSAAPVFDAAQEAVLASWGARLSANPYDAPTAEEVAAGGLTARAVAAAGRTGRFLVLPGPVILHPTAADRALAILATLPQPFTMSQARQALGATRRVAVPLLEHLDARGGTVRVDGSGRRLR